MTSNSLFTNAGAGDQPDEVMGLTPLSIAIDLDQIYCFGAKGDQRLSWVVICRLLQFPQRPVCAVSRSK